MTEPARWRVFGYLAALFVAGGITGAAIMIHMNKEQNAQTLKVGRAAEIAAMITERLDTKLNLTAEQKEKFAPLIKHASEELEASHLDCLKRVTSAIDSLHIQIAAGLTPEQREKMKDVETERVSNMMRKYNFALDPARTNAP